MKRVKELIDSCTLKLLSILYNDSRITYRKLSKKINISPVACYNRVKKLRESGIITGYTIKVDAMKLGYPIKALIEVKARQGLSSMVAKKIFSLKHVARIYEITGERDAIIEAYFRDIRELNEFLKNIRDMSEEILDTVTYIVLDEHENPNGWWLGAEEAQLSSLLKT